MGPDLKESQRFKCFFQATAACLALGFWKACRDNFDFNRGPINKDELKFLTLHSDQKHYKLLCLSEIGISSSLLKRMTDMKIFPHFLSFFFFKKRTLYQPFPLSSQK